MGTRAVWSGEDDPTCRDPTYRYQLEYSFPSRGDSRVLFVMMNPSYASEEEYDNTVRRCTGYAWDWGYGDVLVGNLFAFRTPFPGGGEGRDGKEWDPIYAQDDPVGPGNHRHLQAMIGQAEELVCAWGNADASNETRRELVNQQAQEVFSMAGSAGLEPQALKVNKTGHPAHPLYLAKGLTPTPYFDFDQETAPFL